MSAKVVQYIAREAVRRYGSIEPRLPEKLQRNIRRNLRVTVPRETIIRLAVHYKTVYDYAASILPAFLGPSTGPYADPSDVRLRDFFAAIAKRFPQDSTAVINIVGWYTVHYEYLR